MDQFIILPINVGHGESILVHICHNDKEFNLLIDGGSYYNSTDVYNKPIFNVSKMEEIAKKLVLHGFVISHVDDDHIGGIIHIIREWKRLDQKKDFFLVFNDYIDHSISFSQGEILIDEINQLQKNEKINIKLLNTYSKRYISANSWIQKYLHTLPIQILSIFQRNMLSEKNRNHIYLTFLTPEKNEINAVMQEWKKDKEKRKNGKKSSANSRIINHSSISFLLEYNEYTILLTGDSSIELIKHKLDELHKVIKHIDYINLCHHGAAENNREILELMDKYKCNNVFTSTNSIKYLMHPCLFMLYKLIKRDSQIKIYLTNDLIDLTELPECNLSSSQIFNLVDNADANIKTIIKNLTQMEFPPDKKNLEKLVEAIKDELEKESDGKININQEKLIKEICSQINKEIAVAKDNGRIVCVTDKSYIKIIEDKNEK